MVCDDAENILGLVIRDKVDNDWAYVIMGRDTREVFRYIEGEHSRASIGIVREQLLSRIEEIALSGQTVFPQE